MFANMAQNITQLDDLKTVDTEAVTETVIKNLNLIFQYNQEDIADVLTVHTLDVLQSLRTELSKNLVNKHQEYNSRTLISRKVKHLVVQDIINFGYSIANDNLARDVDKAFTRIDSNTNRPDSGDTEESTVTEMAEILRLITVLQEDMNALKAENKNIKKQLRDIVPCKCKSSHTPGTASGPSHDVNPIPSTSGSGVSVTDPPATSGSLNGHSADSVPLQGSTTKNSDAPITNQLTPNPAAIPISSTDSESTTEDDDVAKFQLSYRELKRKRKQERRASKSNATLRAAKTQAPTTGTLRAATSHVPTSDIYVGNVDPAHSVQDIVSHIKKIPVDIGTSNVAQLRKGNDWKSFRVSINRNDYNKVLHATWPKGIKVRPFAEQKGKHQKRNARKGPRPSRNTQPFRTRSDDWYDPYYEYHQQEPTYEYDVSESYDRHFPRLQRQSWDHYYY